MFVVLLDGPAAVFDAASPAKLADAVLLPSGGAVGADIRDGIVIFIVPCCL